MAKVKYSALASTDLYENAEFIARDKPDMGHLSRRTGSDLNPQNGFANK